MKTSATRSAARLRPFYTKPVGRMLIGIVVVGALLTATMCLGFVTRALGIAYHASIKAGAVGLLLMFIGLGGLAIYLPVHKKPWIWESKRMGW